MGEILVRTAYGREMIQKRLKNLAIPYIAIFCNNVL